MANDGQVIETVESRWGQSIERMFDTPESQVFAPDPSVWVAYLNAGAATVGYFRPPLGRLKAPVVEVRINHGVWQTVCPFCPSAQHASKDDQWFYCARCHNEAAGQMLIPVIWPKEHGPVEELLVNVPEIAMRNWEPGETVAVIAEQIGDYLTRRQG